MKLRPLIFITGKGGVGKSTVAAALAYGLSLQGKKVLLVELAEKSFYEKFFHSKSIEFAPREIAPGFYISLWDYISCLREYVGFYVKTDKIFDLFFSNQVVQKFVRAAPSLKELALLGKATSQPRKVGPELKYDHIIIDSYSTGHHKALLKAPFGMAEIIQRGPMGVHSKNMIQVLQNPDYTQHFIVLKPEELPVVESLELKASLEKEFKVSSQFICNQVVDYPENLEALAPQDSELVDFFQLELQLQNKNLKHLESSSAKSENKYVRYYFEKKDKFAFLRNIYQDLERKT